MSNKKVVQLYIDDKPERGRVIDWNLIFQKYKKLKCPDNLYDPTKTPVGQVHIADILSVRSRGKTTAWLLIALCLWTEYGTDTAYIRQIEDMLAPVNGRELFKTITEYQNGYYIDKLTDGKYNTIVIKSRRAFLAYQEDGEVIEKQEEPFLHMLSIDRNFLYKSSLNLPNCELIIFDEFISPVYRDNEFVDFNDLLSTIIRKRQSPFVVMLANTIDSNNIYFREQEIAKDVKQMKVGDSRICYTTKHMPIYVELDKEETRTIRQKITSLFFGYSNTKLVSITGEGDGWSFATVPHIWHEPTEELLNNRLYIDIDSELLQVEFMRNSIGLCAFVHPATKTPNDCVILTLGEIHNKQYEYGKGVSALPKALFTLLSRNLVYYSDNETGAMLTSYRLRCKVA